MRQKKKMKEDGYERLFSVGLVCNRVGDRKAAEKVYGDLIRRIEEAGGKKYSDVYPDALYNLACLQALSGKKSDSVKTLRKAVGAGFKDLEWIEQDGDLQSIRNEEAYRALIAEKELFK